MKLLPTHGIGLAMAMAAVAASQSARVFGASNIRRYLQQQKPDLKLSRSIAQGNRHGGPHLHRREIDRRLRQAERRDRAAVA